MLRREGTVRHLPKRRKSRRPGMARILNASELGSGGASESGSVISPGAASLAATTQLLSEKEREQHHWLLGAPCRKRGAVPMMSGVVTGLHDLKIEDRIAVHVQWSTGAQTIEPLVVLFIATPSSRVPLHARKHPYSQTSTPSSSLLPSPSSAPLPPSAPSSSSPSPCSSSGSLSAPSSSDSTNEMKWTALLKDPRWATLARMPLTNDFHVDLALAAALKVEHGFETVGDLLLLVFPWNKSELDQLVPTAEGQTLFTQAVIAYFRGILCSLSSSQHGGLGPIPPPMPPPCM